MSDPVSEAEVARDRRKSQSAYRKMARLLDDATEKLPRWYVTYMHEAEANYVRERERPESVDHAAFVKECDRLRAIEAFAYELREAALDALPPIQAALTDHGKWVARQSSEEHKSRRSEKMAHRPVPTPGEMGRVCARCNRKPARIDDLCKVCARAEGILVRGKIGGGA